MKILELRLLNLNSLYGEWNIDFTDPEYAANGIFALTGPTGSGKSTILDAICLALYGATPRLGKITRSSNEIMSRQTGECFAEVVFESQSGSYRCKWAQRKARKSSDGNLQVPEHEISDSTTGILIETKKRSVLEVIEEKTGMDFERFTRSILLAQGGFDNFLKADVEQKSKILEQITGTEIYSEISRRVHERHRAERERLNLLQAESIGITVIEASLEDQMRQDLEVRQGQSAELATLLTNTKIAIDWVNGINFLKHDIQTIHTEEERLKLEIEAFKPQQEKLKLSQKAARLDGEYATLIALRKQQTTELEAVKVEEHKLPEMEISANIQLTSLQAAEQSTLLAKEESITAAPLIQKIRSIDQTVEEKNKIILHFKESCNRDTVTIQQNEISQLMAHSKRLEAVKTLGVAKKYLNDHIHDEWLISNLTGVEVKLKNLLAKQKEISQKENDLKNAESSLADATKKLETVKGQCASSRKEFEQAQTNTQQLKDILISLLGGKPLREFRVEKESLQKEKEYFLRIAALDVHRGKLEDGQPCPLCGSIDHPFAVEAIPLPNEVDQKIESISGIIKKAEDQEIAIQKQEMALSAIRDSLGNSEKSEVIAINDRTTAELKVAETKNSLTQHQMDFDSLKGEVEEKLQPLGIIKMQESLSALFDSLKKRLANWQEHVQKRTEAEKQILTIDSEISSLNAVIESQTNNLNEKQQNLEKLQLEYNVLIGERENLYGSKNPNEEEFRLKNTIVLAEEIEKKARYAYSDLQQSLTAIKLLIHSKKLNVAERSPILDAAEKSFASLLYMENFENEDQYLVAKITIEEQNFISLQGNNLHDLNIQLKAKREDREARLSAEIGKNISEKTSNELEIDYKNIELSLNELRTIIQNIQLKLNENTAAKDRLREKQASIQAQKRECEQWDRLHNLIGSADGKKFRNFAQGLTFELLISHANRYLEKMTDRYLLIRDQDEPLELNVVDNYQAGEVRPTKNLSGGECFIVSLTLALGLSRMSSRKVRVDSLFLDEGFGSLDEETLETALDALSGLHHQGKLICIISHVPALNERISCQLKVWPSYGGRSVVIGPGCRQISAP